jgi:hypothetical protein
MKAYWAQRRSEKVQSPAKHMLIWYGERGVVNAAVTHLVEHNAAAQFLRCVQWADGSSPAWPEKITDVKFVVEVGLAEFANPDLILVCESSADPRPFCLFLEAKVVPYSASAVSNKEGDTIPFNDAQHRDLLPGFADCHYHRFVNPIGSCPSWQRVQQRRSRLVCG